MRILGERLNAIQEVSGLLRKRAGVRVFGSEGERLRAPPGADAARKKLCAVVEICRARAREQISGTTNGKSRPDGLYRSA